MISIRPVLMLFVVSTIAMGCSQAEPKRIPPVTTEQKATNDKAHEEMKSKTGTPAEAPKK